MRPKTLASAALAGFLALVSALAAQHPGHSPYAGHEEREIKALSAEETRALLAGEGMGFAMAAELNHYPGPKHVLELAEELELSAEQRAAIEAVFDRMHERAVALGEELVAAERALDGRFASGAIDREGLAAATAEIARLRGELRFAHLAAHLETRELLTPVQRQHYDRLRGYGGGHGGHGH